MSSSLSSPYGGDLRLTHASMPNWQLGTRQPLQGSDYIIVSPVTKFEDSPVQVDFELPSKKCLLFGTQSKFQICGTFQKLEKDSNEWKNLAAADVSKVLLSPFWFEMLLKEIAIFHNNSKVSSSNEARFIAPFLHAYLHQNMHPTAKKLLCAQPSHPAYCMPSGNEAWTVTSDAWKKYGAVVFAEKPIEFDYTPLFMFPFYQGSNYLIDGSTPRILPTPAMSRIQIRFSFFDSQDHIFKKLPADTNKYRFKFNSFNLLLEEARLSAPFERQLLTSKKQLVFPGVTRLQLVEQVPDESTTYRTRFQEVWLPESLFIFCLPKTVASGTYKFSAATHTTIFLQHNIESLDLSFDGKRFALKEPHIGLFKKAEMEMKQLFDHLVVPPLGVRQDITGLTLENIKEGAKVTNFPHIYLPLVTGPDRQRIVPAHDDGSCMMKKADLELDIKFNDTNSTKDATYIIYACYTDVSNVYDPKTRLFTSPYLQYMN